MTKPPISEHRRRNGLASFGTDVRKIIAPLLGTGGFIQADLLAHWEDILGSALSQGVYPSSIKFPTGKKQEAVLHVKAVSGAFAMAFSAQSAEILERINSYFGYKAIAEIRVTQGALPPAPKKPKQQAPSPEKQQEAAELAQNVCDENLQKALIELGSFLNQKK